MLQARAKILYNKKIKDGYMHCALDAPEISRLASPGQFVSIKLTDTLDPLLRRPFSIHRAGSCLPGMSGKPKAKRQAPDSTELLYEIVGTGTEILAQRRKGEYLDIIGPLGNGFGLMPYPAKLKPILVAGGIGVAPLLFLAERLAVLKAQNVKPEIMVLLGATTGNKIMCEQEFRELGCEARVSTDDGSRGLRGQVTDLLRDILGSATRGGRFTICACGPRAMLESVAGIAGEYGIRAYGSFEAHMACGIGACMGCVIKSKNSKSKDAGDFEYKRICKDGPVFDLSQIVWGGD